MGNNYLWGKSYPTMDRHYDPNPSRMNLDSFEAFDKQVAKVGEPIVGVKNIGKTLPEGQQFGSFIATLQAAVKEGVRSVELETNMGGAGGHVGAESYGVEEREELRNIAKVAGVSIGAVHVPVNIGNMSGWNPQQGMSVEAKEQSKEEVRKAINFAADVGASAITIHTGEYSRSIRDASWNQDKLFDAPERSQSEDVAYVVDSRTGQMIAGMRKSDKISMPKFKTANEINADFVGTKARNADHIIGKDDWIDEDGNILDPTNEEDRKKLQFDLSETGEVTVQNLTYKELEERRNVVASMYDNKDKSLPTEIFYHKINVANQINQMMSNSNYQAGMYGQHKQALDNLKQSSNITDQELEFIYHQSAQAPVSERLSQFKQRYGKEFDEDTFQNLASRIHMERYQMDQSKQILATMYGEKEKLMEQTNNIKALSDFASEQSFDSFAETAVYAWRETQRGHKDGTLDKKKAVYLAPENIFPEMGYGSHPDEIIELVEKSRERFVDKITKEVVYNEDGQLVKNEFFDKNITVKEAQKIAKDHIKMTFDTQHLAMWSKFFKPKYNDKAGRLETPEETEKRFYKWYEEQSTKLVDAGIIGNVHMVDAMGSGHQHLPVGKGKLPIKSAIEYLIKKGYDHQLSSEGHGLPAEMMTKVWSHFGSPITSTYGGGSTSFGGIHQSYFGYGQPPNYIMRSYVPVNDFALWSEVPFE